MKKLLFLLLFTIFAVQEASAFKFASGSYTGDGNDSRNIVIASTTTPSVTSFQPDVVIISGNAAVQDVLRTSAMAGDLSCILVGSSACTTNQIQALNADGFQIGTDATVNTSAVVYYYVALANDANNDLAVGSYTGNATDARDIVISPAFSPEVLIVAGNSGSPVWRVVANTGDQAMDFFNSAHSTNQIQAFNADGFQVGTDVSTNSSGTYYYFALKTVTGSVISGSFTGNATDDRSITVGFQPQWIMLKGNSVTAEAVAKYKDQTTDVTCSLNNSGNNCSASNRLQAFQANGFQVGTSTAVNENTVVTHWMAVRESSTRRRAAPIIMP